MKKIVSLLGAIVITTVGTTSVVACGEKNKTKTFDKTYNPATKYHAVYFKENNIELYELLWDKTCLIIYSAIYQKFENKLVNFIDKGDKLDNISDGTITKIKFKYEDSDTIFNGFKECKFLLLKDLYDIQGTKTNAKTLCTKI